MGWECTRWGKSTWIEDEVYIMYSFCHLTLFCIKKLKMYHQTLEKHIISKLHSSWFFSSHPTKKNIKCFTSSLKKSGGWLNFFRKKTSFKNLRNLRPISLSPPFWWNSASKYRRSGTFRKAIRICVHRRHDAGGEGPHKPRRSFFGGWPWFWASWSPWYHH